MKGYRGHNKMKKNRRQLFAMQRMHPVLGAGHRRTIERVLPYGA